MRKSAINTVEIHPFAASKDGSGAVSQAVSVAPLRASDIILRLKDRLVGLNRQTDNGHRLFRLSYSILTLETCLKEKGMLHIALPQSSGIQTILQRIEGELEILCPQTERVVGDAAAPVMERVDQKIEPVIHSILEAVAHLSQQLEQVSANATRSPEEVDVIRLLADLQKSVAADGRRNYASQAALHASIERLSERLEQIEVRLNPQPEISHSDTLLRSIASEPVKEREPIDPRPMLLAARAAAARALTDIDPKSAASKPGPGRPSPLDEPPRPHRPKEPQARRRWGFSFAVA